MAYLLTNNIRHSLHFALVEAKPIILITDHLELKEFILYLKIFI